MGIWDEGVFDNDGASDYVADLVEQMEARIEQILADDDRSMLDEEGDSVLVPTVELICIICTHVNTPTPRLEVVRHWQEKYLGIYDDQIDNFEPQSEYKLNRRIVIEDTFQRLALLAQSWEEIINRIESGRGTGEA